jgi:hypothetical protein
LWKAGVYKLEIPSPQRGRGEKYQPTSFGGKYEKRKRKRGKCKRKKTKEKKMTVTR